MSTDPSTVLLIEDHVDTRDVYATMLLRAGYRVLTAADGGEGFGWPGSTYPTPSSPTLGRPPWMDGRPPSW